MLAESGRQQTTFGLDLFHLTEPKRVPALGPFAAKPVDIEAIGITTMGGKYKVDLQTRPFRDPEVAALVSSLSGEGRISPNAAVTLDDRDKGELSIPLDAEFVSFASPLIGLVEVDYTNIDLSTPELSFVSLVRKPPISAEPALTTRHPWAHPRPTHSSTAQDPQPSPASYPCLLPLAPGGVPLLRQSVPACRCE